MKFIVMNEKIGTIEYRESFWTGKKELILNGTPLKKISKQEFVYNINEEDKVTRINGNFLSGASVIIDGQVIQIVPKIGPFEILILIFAFFLPLICSSIEAFAVVVPLVGGAIGGLVYAAICLVGITFVKQSKSILAKFISFIGTTIVSFIVGAIVGAILVVIIASLM